MRTLILIVLLVAEAAFFGFLFFSIGYRRGHMDGLQEANRHFDNTIEKYNVRLIDLQDRLKAMHTLFDQIACAVYKIEDKETLLREEDKHTE